MHLTKLVACKTLQSFQSVFYAQCNFRLTWTGVGPPISPVDLQAQNATRPRLLVPRTDYASQESGAQLRQNPPLRGASFGTLEAW